MKFGDLIADVATSYVGQQEIPNNMGFKDPLFNNKMVDVGFRKGHAWCNYFVELVWKETFYKFVPGSFEILDKLFSASTQTTWNNFKNKGGNYGYVTTKTPCVGDLIVWKSTSNPTQGHIGIVTGVPAGGPMDTVEGNTNSKGGREGIEVAAKKRGYDWGTKKSLMLLGFIHYEKEVVIDPVKPTVVATPEKPKAMTIEKTTIAEPKVSAKKVKKV